MEPMRMKWWLFILLAAVMIDASAEPLKYLELRKSKPVEVNGLEFVAATQSQWLAKVGGSIWPIEVQLLITNKSGNDLVFRTFDTFSVVLKNADGAKIPDDGGRDGTMVSLSVLIRARDTYSLARKAELWWKIPPYPSSGTIGFGRGPIGWTLDGKTCAFFYWDGTGYEHSFKPLQPGRYSLSFDIDSSEQDAARETRKLGGLPVWSGTATTKEVPFDIIEQ